MRGSSGPPVGEALVSVYRMKKKKKNFGFPLRDDSKDKILEASHTIMLPVPKVANPRLQCLGVVLVHDSAIGLYGGLTRDGSPFSSRIQEGEVDLGVFVQVVCFAGLGVCVEDEVDAIALLAL